MDITVDVSPNVVPKGHPDPSTFLFGCCDTTRITHPPENTGRNSEDPLRQLEAVPEQQNVVPAHEPPPSHEPIPCLCKPEWDVCGKFTLTRADVISMIILAAVWLFIVLIATVYGFLGELETIRISRWINQK